MELVVVVVLVLVSMVGFPVLFVGIWVAVLGLLSVLSGWQSLRSAHPDPGPEPDRLHDVGTAYMGSVRLRGSVLRLGVSADALHLRAGSVFKPPLA